MTKFGWALSALVSLFLLGASALPKLMAMPVTTEIMTGLGWPDAPIFAIGVLEALLAVALLIPQTAPLAAIVLTGLLGGAIATNLHAGQPLFSHTLFGLYLGIAAWAGLWLRDARLRALLPFAR
jgi:uncharacterized membrane protein